MTKHNIVLQPLGQHIACEHGTTLLEAAQQSGVGLISLCGGIGSCDSCRVRLISGSLSNPTLSETGEFSPDELEAGWRLACQAEAFGDVVIEIPPTSLTTSQRLQIEGQIKATAINPAVSIHDITLDAPSLDDLRSDTKRLRDALPSDVEIPVRVMRDLSTVLRDHDWQARVVIHDNGQVVGILPPSSVVYGLAVDLGTTSIAVYLIDLVTGTSVGKTGMMNPQIAYGEDVISRIMRINDNPDDAFLLQQLLVNGINELAADLCQQAGCDVSQIVDVVVVGNTPIHHLFTRLPVHQLGEAPYIAATAEPMQFSADEIGLKAISNAQVYLPPNIASYVGADHTAMILAAGLLDTEQTVLGIDIGTNTEITLAHHGQLWSCSTASGPAFEGAHIRDGMRAAPGAIERVSLLDGALQIQTIDNQPATGICGSGILDAIAVMRQSGAINEQGRLNAAHPLIDTYHGISGFVLSAGLSQPVIVTRKDVATIQLAKGAIRAGIDSLLDIAGITANMLDQFLIAGAFGTYINIASAIQIGMFPDIPQERFEQIGNAAGMGAWMLLNDKDYREQVAALQINYVELTAYSDFQNKFMEQMNLGANTI